MTRGRCNGRTLRNISMVVAVAVIVPGTLAARAAIPSSPGGVFTGCVSTAAATKGALRMIDAPAGGVCKSTETKVTWNQRGINWRGTWSATTAYALNDAVAYHGSSYIATVASTNSAPTIASKWAVLAQATPTLPPTQFTSSTQSESLGTGNTAAEMLAVQVPWSAHYLVNWHATVVDFGPANTSDFFRCWIYASGPSQNSETGHATVHLNSSPGQDVQTIGNETEISFAPGSAGNPGNVYIYLLCKHDLVLPAGSYYLDPDASVSITPIT